MTNDRRLPSAAGLYNCRACVAAEADQFPARRRNRTLHRRQLLHAATALTAGASLRLGFAPAPARAQVSGPAFSDPMGEPGQPLGEGFIIRHGFACENTIVQTGWLHTAEDWYRTADVETGESRVYAVGDGEVVFAGYDYPGLVIIIQHAPDLFSLYGHLNYDAPVQAGDRVVAGQFIASVLTQIGRRVPSHLHFELRNFLINPIVNGDSPSWGVHCGVNCPPGPGYWPLAAPEHPSVIGWRNPTHVINEGAFGDGIAPRQEVVVSGLAGGVLPIWTAPASDPGATLREEVDVRPGARLPLHAVRIGPAGGEATSADGYELWYEVTVGLGNRGWVQAAVPSTHDTGADGRPSTVLLTLLPDVLAG